MFIIFREPVCKGHPQLIFGVACWWLWHGDITDCNFLKVKRLAAKCFLLHQHCILFQQPLQKNACFFFSGIYIFLSYSSIYVLNSVKRVMTQLV